MRLRFTGSSTVALMGTGVELAPDAELVVPDDQAESLLRRSDFVVVPEQVEAKAPKSRRQPTPLEGTPPEAPVEVVPEDTPPTAGDSEPGADTNAD